MSEATPADEQDRDLGAPEKSLEASQSEESSTRAELMLLIATAVWGVSFVLARNLGEAGNAMIGLDRGGFGPTLILGIRFLLAAILWTGFRWLWSTLRHPVRIYSTSDLRTTPPLSASMLTWGLGVGVLLAIGLVLQHIALDLIRGDRAEAMTAFLTSLTVVFVPLAVWLVWRVWPSRTVAVGIALAIPGVWLMSRVEGSSADDGSSMGVGIVLGVSCAFVFAWHLLGVSHVSRRIGAGLLNTIQFAAVGVVCLLVAMMMSIGHPVDSWNVAPLLTARSVMELLLLIFAPTLISFGLMSRYQREVVPARAALIYMLEPVFAALFAWILAGKALGMNVLLGAGLILLANVLVELWPHLRKSRRTQPE